MTVRSGVRTAELVLALSAASDLTMGQPVEHDREVDVLRLLARGATNAQMAAQLHLSPKTVGHHVAHVYDKLGVRTRAGATLAALQHDLLAAGT